MMKIHTILYACLLVLVLSACQGNNSTTTEEQDNSVDLDSTAKALSFADGTSSKVLTKNSEVTTINVKVYNPDNSLLEEGNISVAYPAKVRTGVDVGSFEKSKVVIENGVAKFNYTAPKDLQARVDAGDTSSAFTFYLESNASVSKVYTFSYNPDPEQTILTSYALANSFPDGLVVGLESISSVSFFVEDADGNKVKDTSMLSMTVQLDNQATTAEGKSYLEDVLGNIDTKLTFENENDISMNIRTGIKSGLLKVTVSATFIDINGEEQTLEEVFSVTVLSGPPSAMSFSYAGTLDRNESERNGKFVERWVLTVTDRYNNRVNTNPTISMGALAGFAKDPTYNSMIPGNYLYYEPNEADNIGSFLSGSTNRFSVNTNVFQLKANDQENNIDAVGVDPANDILVTFGNGYTYDASGKWDFNTNTGSYNIIDIVDVYKGESVSGMGFAVGRNYKQDVCRTSREWVVNVYPEDGNYNVDSTGSVKINVEYDYYMIGKDVMLWANLVGSVHETGETVRVGEVVKMTPRGKLYSEDECTVPPGTTSDNPKICTFVVDIHNSITEGGETQDLGPVGELLRNANIGFRLFTTGDVSASGMQLSGFPQDCSSGGPVVIYLEGVNPGEEAGTMGYTNVRISNEF